MILPGGAPLTETVTTLLHLIAPPPRPPLGTRPIDWHAIDELARYTHVAARLWFALKEDPLLNQVPPVLAERFRRAYVENARRNRLLRAQILGVARRLNAAGQAPLLLKGASYIFDPPRGHAALRYLHDLDVMAADHAACQACLLANGLRELGKVARPRAEASYHHWPALVDPTSGLEVEVHKRPFITADAAMTAVFLESAVPHVEDGVRVMLPSRACRIALNVIHTQISDRGLGLAWFNPRYLAEFADHAVAWTADDWAAAEAIMAGNRIAFGSFRVLAEDLMGVKTPLPSPVRAIDRVEIRRIRAHRHFRPRRGPLAFAIGRTGLIKDRLRRRIGPLIGWHSVARGTSHR